MKVRGDPDESSEIKQTWQKLENNAKTSGYREGIEAGKDELMQNYFDRGYMQGFKIGFEIGKYKSKIYSLSSEECSLNKANISKFTENPSEGYCIICKNEEFLSKPVEEIEQNQLELINTNFNQLYCKYHSTNSKLNLVKELKST